MSATRPNRKSRLASATKPAMPLLGGHSPGNSSPKWNPARCTGSPAGKSRLSAGSGSAPSPHFPSRVTRKAVQETDLALQQALEASKAANDPAAATAAVVAAGGSVDMAQSQQPSANQQPAMPMEPPKVFTSAPGQASGTDQQHGAANDVAQTAHAAEGAPLPNIITVQAFGDHQHADESTNAGHDDPSAEVDSAAITASAEPAAGEQESNGQLAIAQPVRAGGELGTQASDESLGAAQPASAAAEMYISGGPVTSQGTIGFDEPCAPAQPVAPVIAANVCDHKDPASKASATPALDVALAARKDCSHAAVSVGNTASCSQEVPYRMVQTPAQDPAEPSQSRSQNGQVDGGPQAAQHDASPQGPAAHTITAASEPHAQGSLQGAIHHAQGESPAQDGELHGDGINGAEEQLHFLERKKARACMAETAAGQDGSSSMQQPCPAINGQLLSARSNVSAAVLRHHQRALWSQ